MRLPAFFLFAGLGPAAALGPETETAFRRHIQAREEAIDRDRIHGEHFLWAEESQDRLRRVRSGEVVIDPVTGKGDLEVKGGLVHDWIGAVFIPGAQLERVLARVQNYDNHKNVYKPEVIDSRTLSRQGNDYRIYLRLLKKKVITVVLNTEHDVRYFPLDATRAHSRSYSTRIAEVSGPGGPGEHELAPGKDHGFLWRLYSYWRFAERDGGVYVECEAVSLTRGVPFGTGWLIVPIIRELPRESLASTLGSTRDSVR